MSNFIVNKGSLNHLEYNNLYLSGSQEMINERVYSFFSFIKLKSLIITKTNMLQFQGGKKLCHYLVSNKRFEHLQFSEINF